MIRLFDTYNRQARLYPALLTVLPVVVVVLAAFPQILTNGIGTALIAVAVTSGLIFFLSDIGRTLGKRLERTLLGKWGGWPTTIWLRHASEHLVSATKSRYHAFLQCQVPGIALPTREMEAQDTKAADEAYASAVEWLKERCRGKKFPLVEKENASYGFRRNLRGLKPIGLVVSSLALVTSVYLLVLGLERPWSFQSVASVSPTVAGAAVFAFLALAGWSFFVTPAWVRQGGDAYARALLACCDSLEGEISA